jgi:hypothetical protein
VKLPEDLSIDLWAFCEAHYGAAMARIVREALRMFINTQLAKEPETKRRFEEAKALRARQTGTLSLVTPHTAYPETKTK